MGTTRAFVDGAGTVWIDMAMSPSRPHHKNGPEPRPSSTVPAQLFVQQDLPAAARRRRLRLGGDLLEVVFDDFAIAGRHIARQFHHRFGSLFLGQLAPTVGYLFQSFRIDLARTAARAGHAVVERSRRSHIIARRTAGLPTVRSGTTV